MIYIEIGNVEVIFQDIHRDFQYWIVMDRNAHFKDLGKREREEQIKGVGLILKPRLNLSIRCTLAFSKGQYWGVVTETS